MKSRIAMSGAKKAPRLSLRREWQREVVFSSRICLAWIAMDNSSASDRQYRYETKNRILARVQSVFISICTPVLRVEFSASRTSISSN